MWAAITSIVTAIAANFSKSWEQYQQRKQAEHETALAIELGKQKIIEKQIEQQHKLSLEQIKSTPRWFKILTFISWYVPFITVIVLPEVGIQIFQNLAKAPQWYVETSIILLFAVWGIAVSKETLANVFSGIADFFRRGQELKFRRKVFYDALRRHKGYLLKEDVVRLEEAINKALEKDK